MLKTDHLIFNTAALVMNRYKNRAETGLQNLDNRAILCKVRGIGAAGSAFASHVKGRGFESHMLHGKGLVDTRPFIFGLFVKCWGMIACNHAPILGLELFLCFIHNSMFLGMTNKPRASLLIF